MTIHRTINDTDVEIVLTEDELWRAYQTEKIALTADDVKDTWEDEYDEPFPYTDEEAMQIASDAWDGMYGSDYYMDCYWEFITSAVKDYKEVH